ncbi:MAG: DUF4421 domain-containing protein [Bacteroidota bacterium]|nr:DUF4421 domain-containing protein [Bacteroidota bacterium]MDX5431802.1 DUF4421 domain-containing protein [Bacteroidota bacterium]MDX5470513.1 DUF4421 domain-containing protein [Bacteroidota bacterium]
MRKLIFIFTLVLSTPLLWAQVDTNFVQRFPDKLVLSPYISSYSNSIQFIPKSIPGDSLQIPLTYEPNLRGGFGISVSYRIIDFSLGVRQKITEDLEKKFGKSSQVGLSFRLWASRKVLTEFNFQSIKGYANLSTPQYDTINYAREYPYQLRPDFSVQYLKIRMVYQSNPDKFSYRSSFAFSERQKRRAGGFLLNVQLYAQNAQSDSSFIPYQIREDYGDFGQMNQMAIAAAGIAPGLGGTLTKGRWFLTGVLFLGVDVQRLGYDVPGSSALRTETKMAAMADLRISWGYNSPRFFFGVQSWNDYNFLRPTPFKINAVFTRGLISMGWRFTSPKLLDKSYDFAVKTIIPKRYRHFMY